MTTGNDQQRVRHFRRENALKFPTPDKFLSACFTASEAQELVDALIRLEYPTFLRGRKMDPEQAVHGELGDVYFMLITTANLFEVDLTDCLEMTLEKLTKRIKEG